MKPQMQIIGSGGAFDTNEGNSSFLFTIQSQNVLIDCGSDVFARLERRNLLDKIDAVAITHTHDDHIGSLSALIYYRFLVLGKKTTIVTEFSVANILTTYLTLVCGHTHEQFEIRLKLEGIEPFTTYGRHVKGLASCGFIMKSDGFNIVFSGDIGTVLTPNEIWASGFEKHNTIVFHDVTTKATRAHPHYEQVEKLARVYAVYGYHHSATEEEEIFSNTTSLETVNTY